MNKWSMHNPESFIENETHKLLWCIKIQTEHEISARLSYNNKKKTCINVDSAVLADYRAKSKECE